MQNSKTKEGSTILKILVTLQKKKNIPKTWIK